MAMCKILEDTQTSCKILEDARGLKKVQQESKSAQSAVAACSENSGMRIYIFPFKYYKRVTRSDCLPINLQRVKRF